MAEKYGEIPKLFTKQWWEYFWDYYKIHTIVVLFLIISIVGTVYSFVTRTIYDLEITYAGEMYFKDEEIKGFTDKVEGIIPDVDENGQKNVYVRQITYSDVDEATYIAASNQRLFLEFTSTDVIMFVLSKEKAEYVFSADGLEGAFKEVSSWCDETDEDRLLYSKDGKAYGVRLDDGVFAKYSEPLYIAVRAPRENNKKFNEKIKIAEDIGNYLVKK